MNSPPQFCLSGKMRWMAIFNHFGSASAWRLIPPYRVIAANCAKKVIPTCARINLLWPPSCEWRFPGDDGHQCPELFPDTRFDQRRCWCAVGALGIAMHSVDLGKLRVAESVAIIGCGPIGLLTCDWQNWPAQTPFMRSISPCAFRKPSIGAQLKPGPFRQRGSRNYQQTTAGRGVDVVLKQPGPITPSSRRRKCSFRRSVGAVGIPGDDKLHLRHSTARRKDSRLSCRAV